MFWGGSRNGLEPMGDYVDRGRSGFRIDGQQKALAVGVGAVEPGVLFLDGAKRLEVKQRGWHPWV